MLTQTQFDRIARLMSIFRGADPQLIREFMQADCESVLLGDGSEQDDLWGANWYPDRQRVEFGALINIRPRLENRSVIIQSQDIRQQVETITRQILGDVE